MLYEEYHDLKLKYNEAKRDYEKALDKKVKLFYDTQPQAVKVKEIVNHISPTSDKFLNYCADIEIVEFEIDKTRNILGVREYQLKLKEKELRESEELLDKIYVLKYLHRMKVKHIAIRINYSREQTYRYLREIEEKLKDDTK